MDGLEGTAAENARLVAIRAALLDDAAVIAAAEARRIRLLAETAEIARVRTARLTTGNSRMREMALRSVSAELGAALRVNDRTMQRRIDEAERMLRMFPATVDALAAGRIDRARAEVILEAGCVIDDDTERAAFERVALERAENETAPRLRSLARQLAERLNPRTIDERFALAHERRLVTVTEVDDGMAEIRALLPVVVAFGIVDRLTRQAKAIHEADAGRRAHAEALADSATAHSADPDGGSGAASEPVRFDERTRDQVRADLFADLLLTGSPAVDPAGDRSPGGLGAIRAQVQITVPVTTCTGVTPGGGELNGRAPVDSETARRLAGDAPGWDRVMTDPVSGTVLDVDRYKPLAGQQRFLQARDVHCRYPGCRRPARECQLDHNQERQHGGRTTLSNLASFCLRHHTLKTETEWTVEQLPGGSLEWTSPLGFTYRDDPPPRVVFLPDPDPAPF